MSALLSATPGLLAAQEHHVVVERGTEGLVALPMTIANATGRAIACEAAIAHWYSLEIARAEAGATAHAVLWSRPDTGAVYVLNEHTDRMPIEALWCGFAGEAAATRYDIRLARRAGTAEEPVDLTCTGAGETGRLACRAGGAE